jgi:hypothetical protein
MNAFLFRAPIRRPISLCLSNGWSSRHSRLVVFSMFSSETKGIDLKLGIAKVSDQPHVMPVINAPHDIRVSADNRSPISEVEQKNGSPEVPLTVEHIGAPNAAQNLLVEDAVGTVVLTQSEKVNIETGVLETPEVPIEKSIDEGQSIESTKFSQDVGEVIDAQSTTENVSKSIPDSDQDPKAHSTADNSSAAKSQGIRDRISRMYAKQMARVAVFKEDWRQMEEASAPRPDDEDYEPNVVTIEK